MRQLENAFRFTFKNFIITLPLLISAAIVGIIKGVGSASFTMNSQSMEALRTMMDGLRTGNVSAFGPEFYNTLYGPAFKASIAFAGLMTLVFAIVVNPATYGMLNKAYETGSAKLNDFSSSMSKYIGRYVLYLLLNVAIGIGVVIVATILITISAIITAAIMPLGILMMVIFILASIAGTIALYTYLNLWFPAVCVEDSGIMDGLKNSFITVKGSFWPILGVTLLVSLSGSVAGSILGVILGWIPIISGAVAPVVTALAEFVLMVYYFEVYREKTGRYTVVVPPQINEINQNGDIQ